MDYFSTPSTVFGAGFVLARWSLCTVMMDIKLAIRKTTKKFNEEIELSQGIG
jgi:hypothetical protein